jgi:hypothetical protein
MYVPFREDCKHLQELIRSFWFETCDDLGWTRRHGGAQISCQALSQARQELNLLRLVGYLQSLINR